MVKILFRLTVLSILVLCLGNVNAQNTKLKFQEKKGIVSPGIIGPSDEPAPDTLFEESDDGSEMDADSEIEIIDYTKKAKSQGSLKSGTPYRELPIVTEDTSDLAEGETEIVEIAEEVAIDSVWIKIAEYYALWDTRRVNPYNIDPLSLKDTVELLLYNQDKGFGWAFPIRRDTTYITSRFGMRGYRFHYGTDLKLDIGDTLVAAFDGIVRIRSFDRGGYGYYILLRHYNGLETVYGHMSRSIANPGQYVKAGEVIGIGGNTGRSTGPHLHFEVRYQGNAFDSENVFDYKTRQIKDEAILITPSKFNYVREARRVVYHKIRSGDTLGAIARKYRTSVGAICRLNGISPRKVLRVGARLRVR